MVVCAEFASRGITVTAPSERESDMKSKRIKRKPKKQFELELKLFAKTVCSISDCSLCPCNAVTFFARRISDQSFNIII